MADFSSVSTAFSGLQAAQAGMLITSQNVAGSAVEGYSRRRTEIAIANFSTDSRAVGGTSFAVEGFSRDYSRLLETQRGKAYGQSSQFDALVTGTATLDAVVLDSSSSVGTALDKFYGAAGALARNPADTSLKAQFFGSARQLVERVNGVLDSVNAVRDSAEYGLKESLANTNRLGEQLASVNEKIIESYSVSGYAPSADLLDRRDQLVMAMQKEIGGQVVISDDGMANLYVNGTPIVDRNGAARLSYEQGSVYASLSDNPEIIGSTLQLQGNAAGKATANFRLLDEFVPELKDQIGQMMKTIADGVNGKLAGLQPTAAPAPVPPLPDAPGPDLTLFSYAIDAKGAVSEFRVRTDLDESASTMTATEANGVESLRQEESGPVNQWASFTNHIGGSVASWKAESQASTYVAQKLDQDHEKVAGVNLDEEAVNLLKFQQLYGASSKVLQMGSQLFEQLLSVIR